jgi:PhoPQ-activated pathogenicity-related protein
MKISGRGRLRSTAATTRLLQIEPLEERRYLSVSPAAAPAAAETPWHNDTYRLDVNNDAIVTTSDIIAIVNRILTQETSVLPVPAPDPVKLFYDVTGDNKVTNNDLLLVINGLLSAPDIKITTLAPFTPDLTPEITVTATANGSATMPNGALVELDLDLNGDSDFDDPGERAQTTSTLYNGQARFNLNHGLPATPELYQARMQARVKNSEAVRGTSPEYALEIDLRTSNVLENYVNTPDPAYEYHQVGQTVSGVSQTPYKYYVLDMTSQKWRSEADVNLPYWHHWMEVYVPYDSEGQVADLDPTSLLFIRGGSNTSNAPTQPDPTMATYATANASIVTVLRIVPNEDVIFTDETTPREEDEIIAYTLDKYLGHLGEPGNDTWPLLLPMVKSAVRAMDTVQDFAQTLDPTQHVDNFFVSGESKRGWTTWLTAAVDDRVRGIMPGVFDNLNQASQMVNHYGVLGKFSEEVRDYTNKNIFERILTPEAQLLGKIVDPYSYLRNGRFDDMPKLVLNSAGDEFFVPDSSRFYFKDLPGTQNYLRYIPNTGHGLDERAVSSRMTFYDAILHDRPLPKYDWTVEQDGSIHVHADTAPSQVLLWQKINPDARDFRSGYTPQYVWTSTTLTDLGGGNYVGDVDTPATGAIAYLVELTFPNSVPGMDPYVFTTEARMKSNIPLAAWPYDPGLPVDPLAAADRSSFAAKSSTGIDDGSRNSIATALVMNGEAAEANSTLPTTVLWPSLSDELVSSASTATSREILAEDSSLESHATDDSSSDDSEFSLDTEVDEELLALLV